MKYSELTSLSDEQLVHKELALERELTAFRFRLFIVVAVTRMILHQQELLHQYTINQMSCIGSSTGAAAAAATTTTTACCGIFTTTTTVIVQMMMFHQTRYGTVLMQYTPTQRKYGHGL